MFLRLMTFAVVSGLLLQLACAEEPQTTEAAADPKAGEIAKYEGDANDADALLKYAGEVVSQIAGNIQEDPDAAEKQLNNLEETFKNLKIENEEAEQVRERVNAAGKFFRERIELARLSLDDLKKALEASADVAGVQKYLTKLSQEIGALADRDHAAAEKQVAESKEFLDALGEKSEDDGVKTAIEQSARIFTSLERQIASARKLAELIGKDAAPLAVEAWVNGEPVTDDDLKGKVVLLDFWAVWCGPCIATFPHLREWQEKYGKDGLTIIGLTRYYNMKWDEEAGRATRSEEEVNPEDEQAMLSKFAEHHKLQHRFGIQKDTSSSAYYAVTGIPHVVLIDREGKVQLVRVGSGPANTKDIDEKIKELLAK